MKKMIILLTILLIIFMIMLVVACTKVSGRCSRMEEEWDEKMANYKKEYQELEQEFLDGRISDKEFLEEYNKLKEKESNDMIKSDGTGEQHEHI